MRKCVVVLLCLSMALGLLFPANIYAVDYTKEVKGVIVEAQHMPAGVDVTLPITEAGWGKPVIHVDKDSENSCLTKYQATPEAVEMDMYMGWDDSNLYIGIVSPDSDIRGTEAAWEGDGVQFKVSSGTSMSAEAANIYFTFGEDNVTITEGDNSKSYAKNLQIVDGKMHATIAVPFKDLGMISEDVKKDAPISISFLRISGTAENPYAGWLAWGAFFGSENELNQTCKYDNLIVLSGKTAAVGNVLTAGRSYSAPVVGDAVTSNTWGKPVIHVDKNSYNTTLKAFNDEPEDSAMDIYATWDAEYLYLGIVSPDTDPRGAKDPWEGDGIQFKISAGAQMASDAKNIYFSLGEDNSSITIGANDENCTKYKHSLTVKDGMMTAAIAIPHVDLGMMAADVKAGAQYSFSILRISGTVKHPYAGWLSYGAFFGPNNENNPNSFGDNVIVLSGSPTETATVITADKVSSEFSVTNKIAAGTWGLPSISVNKNSINTSLKRYQADPEDSDMDIYLRWDKENIYVGVVSPDTDVRGGVDPWTGDGIQFKLSPGRTMAADAMNVYFTLGEDKATITAGDNIKTYTKNVLMEDGKMYAYIAIPHKDLGMIAEDVKGGAEYSFSILRISGTAENEYAGWLAYGAFFGAANENNPDCTSDNLIVLVDPDDDGSEEEGDTFKSLLLDIPKSASGAMAVKGTETPFGNGVSHKIVKTTAGTFAVYLTRASITNRDGKSAVNEFTLQKIEGGSSKEVAYGYAYSGVQDVFADTDGNVYVVGGGSTWDLDSMLSGKNTRAEKTVLNIWKYNEKGGTLNGYTSYLPFTVATAGYSYLGSSIDPKAGKIYTAYIGADADGIYTNVEYFTFDISTMKWSKESVSYKLNGKDAGNFAVYTVDDGMGTVYANADGIYLVKANGTQNKILSGKLCNVYKDTQEIRILYTSNDDKMKSVTVKQDGTVGTSTQTDISSTAYEAKFVQAGNACHIVALDKANPVEAVIYSASDGANFSESSRIKLDNSIVYSNAYMSASPDNGSVNDKITIMFAGRRGTKSSWYYAEFPIGN